MINEELYNGREDGRIIKLPDYLPNEVHIPYVNLDIVNAIENSEDPTQPIIFHQSIYKLDTNELKYKYAGEAK
jgi:hypothetical protein